MSEARSTELIHEETPVDDVRRVRERLDREAGSDVHVLIERSKRNAAAYIEKFGLKHVGPSHDERP